MRKSGILMPIFSLASKYGIGTFGKEAYEFVDFLKKSGQSYWQILPLNPTNYGDSPYQSFSSAAGNPYFIDLDILCEEGLLKKSDYVNVDFGNDATKVDYGKLYLNRLDVLKIAFQKFKLNMDSKYRSFCKQEMDWLDEYAVFMAVKDKFDGKSWRDWEDGYKRRNPKILDEFKKQNAESIEFYKFVQFKFFEQWGKLKEYANKNNIKIIGDMPIYVADDSADVWSDTKQFDLDDELLPKVVAGCPPDAFTEDGQLWGMPVYNWKFMKDSEIPYEWWRKRIGRALKVYDVIRIDHFRGFESFYCIKYGAVNAKKGTWRKGPGMSLFKALQQDFGDTLPIIAEDLGFLTPKVRKLLKDSGFPGMKVLQFAFDTREESDYLPHNYKNNCVVYTGTHDNDTIMGWTKSADKADVEMARSYMHVDDEEGFNWCMIRTAMMSVADTAIFMMQDFMGLGSEARINTPSTVGGNWTWRITDGCINDWLAGLIYENTFLYGRVNK